MSLELTSEGIQFTKINLKYLKTSTDNYGNENSYYAVLNDNIKEIIKDVSTEMKVPYFLGKEQNYILKNKSKYLTDAQKISGTATIKMKAYNYEKVNGYYINEIIIV